MDSVSNILNNPSFPTEASTIRDLVCTISVGVAVVGVSFFIYAKVSGTGFFCKQKCNKKVNFDIKKGEAKIVDNFDIEDIGDKKVLLVFPYCDGSHTNHNMETGDNVGPLIIGKKSN
uniref:Iron-binding zinc finger CDGSH type domain-containing protein n=1 Tax=Daphnia galeata TaxID=27404 RepID=A0A8J2S3Q0_9CRUS|nr:unnamed protein product [Daphnia galeata]